MNRRELLWCALGVSFAGLPLRAGAVAGTHAPSSRSAAGALLLTDARLVDAVEVRRLCTIHAAGHIELQGADVLRLWRARLLPELRAGTVLLGISTHSDCLIITQSVRDARLAAVRSMRKTGCSYWCAGGLTGFSVICPS